MLQLPGVLRQGAAAYSPPRLTQLAAKCRPRSSPWLKDPWMSSSLRLGDQCFFKESLAGNPPMRQTTGMEAVVFHPLDANVRTAASWWEVILTRLSSTAKTVAEDNKIAAEGCSPQSDSPGGQQRFRLGRATCCFWTFVPCRAGDEHALRCSGLTFN